MASATDNDKRTAMDMDKATCFTLAEGVGPPGGTFRSSAGKVILAGPPVSFAVARGRFRVDVSVDSITVRRGSSWRRTAKIEKKRGATK